MKRMRILCGFVAVMSMAAAKALPAQTSAAAVPNSPVATVANSKPWEYGALLQGGVGLEDRTNFSFLMVGVHVGKVLTTDFGTGALKGNIEYAVEVLPFWQSYTPRFQRISCSGAVPVETARPSATEGCSAPYTVGGTYAGSSITPIMVRYNFTHGTRFMPWIQAAGGVVWTDHKYPAVGDLNPDDPTQTGPASDTSVWNFTPQGGIGAHYFVKPRRVRRLQRQRRPCFQCQPWRQESRRECELTDVGWLYLVEVGR